MAERESKIQVLDFEVANLIAAGEVVDRPASVIKELTENAIDSGATTITVEIKHGGVTYMRVTDNGCGIDFDELPTAILRHATSKIKTASDLMSIGTLGFRGEALAAIAAVSRLRIMSRPADSPLGGLLAAEGGRITEHTETGCSVGTTVIVEELFSNVPARRKFLKKDSAEAAAVITVVERIALSRPDISFRLICNGDMKIRTEGDGDLGGAIYSVLGRDFRSRAIHVDQENSGLRVSGFIGMPDTARANRNGEIFFINGRYVRSKTAGAALEEAFRTYIPDDRFPSAVLSIEIAPDTVDVNVHPAKLEVKFSNEKLVFETVFYACRPALERGMTTGALKVTDEPESPRKAAPDAHPASSGSYADYFRRAVVTSSSFAPVRDGTPVPRTIKIDTDSSHPVLGGTAPRLLPQHLELNARHADGKADVHTASFAKEGGAPAVHTPSPVPDERPTSPIPDYTILGEAWDCYIVVTVGEKLILIDKHAAHERILFEQLRRSMRHDPAASASQVLLVPVTVSLTETEADNVAAYEDEIRDAGFSFTRDGRKFTVTSIPSGFSPDAVPSIFETFGSELYTSPKDVRDEIFERALYTTACKAAIKGGRAYGAEHIRWLCDELFRLPDVKYCPHGRPVALEISHSSLDRHFRRTE